MAKTILKVKLGDKEYKIDKVKARVLKRALEFQNEDEMTYEEQFDKTLELIVLTFDNKFTEDDLLDNLSTVEVIDLCKDVTNNMLGRTSKKFNELGKN